jgi:hypothetical protein
MGSYVSRLRDEPRKTSIQMLDPMTDIPTGPTGDPFA